MLVERVEIGKWPYGTAWGRFLADGVPGEHGKVANAGSYQWKDVTDQFPAQLAWIQANIADG